MNGIFRYPYPAMVQRGLVLVIVLWIVALLSVMAGAFAYSMRVETRLATSAAERAQARALAEAGVAYAIAWQLDFEVQKQWPSNGDSHEWSFGGGQLRIAVVDAAGLVSLNAADTALLKALLGAAGVDPQEQDRLAEAIVDWRTPDQQLMSPGAGSAEYRAAGRSGPKNAPFESIEELQQVLGITREIYQRIAPGITVFSNQSRLSPEWTPAWLLRAIGLDERDVAEYVEQRARAAADGSLPPSLPAGASQPFFSTGRTNVYHIVIRAETANGAIAGVEAVAGLQGTLSGHNWWRLLAWREVN